MEPLWYGATSSVMSVPALATLRMHADKCSDPSRP